MRSVWVWLVLAIPAGWAIWQLQLPDPVVSAPFLGLLLLILGLLAGLRLASDGLHRLLQDLIRVNRTLAEQYDEIAEKNRRLQAELDSGQQDSDGDEGRMSTD